MSQLAAREPEVRSFEATVADIDGRAVTLDESYFYAESGGQPADRGNLGGVAVEHVEKGDDGEVVHHLAADPDFEAGETVRAQIDDDFRTYTMRAHTASHVLYGAGRKLLDDLGYGGFGIDERKVRVDFTTTTDIDDETLVELERLVNRAVWDSLDVTWEDVSEQEAREREEVAFNTKTEEGVMSESDAVRVVTVDDWDWAACGGTHVSNTSEIGPVTVLDRSNPGEGMTRVEFAVGPAAIRRRAADARAAREAARTLDVGVADLPEAADRVSADVEELQSDLADAKEEVLAARLADLGDDPVERDGGEWLVGTVLGFGPNEVADRARELAGDAADAVVLAGEDGATFVVAATSGTPEAGEVVDEVTDAFGGGGGGSPTFAQGGGLNAAPEEVVAFLRE
ncbi:MULTISPECIES: DHHA1 domain-containing protein [Halorussus]|uniref:alanine--tRNA ligase-related protein n=1 Tax=Halorussus TaxID=1070314 RepID=UPI00209DD74B|nr:DHHA1 domain-containing protein [Halorussus vallis]USZ76869.1 DHHA1 domain-containing protein [Halorussus vallis]